MAAFTQTDFDNAVTALNNAIIAGNRTSALQSAAQAHLIQMYLFKMKLTDAGSEVQRWSYKDVVATIESYFKALYEAQGTSAENTIPAPISAEGGDSYTTKAYPPIAPAGS